MKIRMIGLAVITCLMASLLSCKWNNGSKEVALAPNAHKVIAEEVFQGGSYSYVRVSSEGSEYWIAITKSDVRKGNTYYWSVGSEMKEFTSKEMKRTFRSIFFVEDFTDQPITGKATAEQMQSASVAGRQVPPEQPGIIVPKIDGGITIAELYERKSTLGGKKVKVCGQVVKFAGGIMNKNWVHIQDGTKNAENYDLTIATKDSTKVGDIVVYEGVVAIDKNIGAGYFYSILIEEAILKK